MQQHDILEHSYSNMGERIVSMGAFESCQTTCTSEGQVQSREKATIT